MNSIQFRQFVLLIVSVLTIATADATNPQNSKWFVNLSEGAGETETGKTDYNPTILSSGDVIHAMWMTDDAQTKVYYRRSTDKGMTWEPKKLLIEGSLDRSLVYERMAVSGDYVHIILNVESYNASLYYLRSIDGGASFEPADTLFKTGNEISNIQLEAEGARLFISCLWYCHFCVPRGELYLIRSEDNGGSFTAPLKITEFPSDGYAYINYDLEISGDYVYIPYYEVVGSWYNYDYNLHLLCSGDRGNSFSDKILSVPSQNGIHHPFAPMNSNIGYTSKIAADGQKIWLIWSGLDQNNTNSVFIRTSHDGGNTFSEALKINGTYTNLNIGFDGIAGKGNSVYVVFTLDDGQILIARSHDGGMSFGEPAFFTEPTGRHISGGWETRIMMAPGISEDAYVISPGLLVGHLRKGVERMDPKYIGFYNMVQRRPSMTIDPDGTIHLIVEGGRFWLATGWFADDDIWYRRIDPGFTGTAGDNQALQLGFLRNPGDGSGVERADNLIIPASQDLSFTDAYTIEFWVNPEQSGDNQCLLTQMHQSTWNPWDPQSTQLWLQPSGDLVCGIYTETGGYAISNSPSQRMKFGYWNHIAITYNSQAEGSNFIYYLNGQLAAEAQTDGFIEVPDLLWIFGATEGNVLPRSFQGQLDEVRFWNVARTQEQIRSTRYRTLSGQEDGLSAYYPLDAISHFGEVPDKTGNGNTGYLMHAESLVPSTISDPAVRFTYVQSIAECYFTQATRDANLFEWDFGDGTTSTLANPKHIYLTPGIFQTCLAAYGPSGYDVYCEEIEVPGIEKLVPSSGGNAGTITVFVYGGGFNAQSDVFLTRNGGTEIQAVDAQFNPADKTLTVLFDLTGAAIGTWNVTVRNNTGALTLQNGFTIVEGKGPKPFVTLASGGGTQLVNRWRTMILNVGNQGDSDAYGVLFWLAVPETSETEVRFLNLNVEIPEPAITGGYSDFMTDYVGEYLTIDSLFDDGLTYHLYGYYFPVIPAGHTFPVTARVMSSVVNQNFQMQTWVTGPIYVLEGSRAAGYSFKREVIFCQGIALAKAITKFAVGLVPGLPCVTGPAQIIFDSYQAYTPPTPSSNHLGRFEIDVKSSTWTYASVFFECATSLAPSWANPGNYERAFKGVQYAVSLFTATVEGKQENDDCVKGFYKIDFWSIPFVILGSLDPNEKTGIHGPAESNYIRMVNAIPYTILFENKSTATAPALEVFIYDTLDMNTLDLHGFQFGPFGFGDTIINPLPGQTEFAVDIDLRPSRDLIVRVEGTLDTASGVVRWVFRSLDPETMDLTEDPLGGFLPPNVSSPEGEGFVSFWLKPAAHLGHGDVIQNKASIVFDLNAPIVTNTHRNAFDLRPPVSECTLVSDPENTVTLEIEVDGTDSGSGIRWYEIWVSKNDSAFALYKTITQSTFQFSGASGSHYTMYSIAVDSVGNREVSPVIPDLEFDLFSATKEETNETGISIYPNVTSSQCIVEITLTTPVKIQAHLLDARGNEVSALFTRDLYGQETQIPVSLDVPSGLYFIRLTAGNRVWAEKIIVQ